MAGGIIAKQISRRFEYFSAWRVWILFLQMHQTVPATSATGVNDVIPAEAGDRGWGQPWAFLPWDNQGVAGRDIF